MSIRILFYPAYMHVCYDWWQFTQKNRQKANKIHIYKPSRESSIQATTTTKKIIRIERENVPKNNTVSERPTGPSNVASVLTAHWTHKNFMWCMCVVRTLIKREAKEQQKDHEYTLWIFFVRWRYFLWLLLLFSSISFFKNEFCIIVSYA